MAKLTLFLQGTKIAEYELKASQEYVIGRASTCDIVLDHAEVSRQHARLYFDSGEWSCNVLSRYGRIFANGAPVEDVSLVNGAGFSIPPFDLKFQDAGQSFKGTDPSQAPHEIVPTMPDEDSAGNLDKTQTGINAIKSVLLRLDDKNSPTEEITLGTDLIEAGRSRSCQIQLHDGKTSRKHFTLQFDGEHFILRDLETANKTFVNGQPASHHKLQSGDEITVGTDRFRFEQVNPEFENLPMIINDDKTEPAVIKMLPQPVTQGWDRPYPGTLGPVKTRKAKVNSATMAILAVLVLTIVYMLSTDSRSEKNNSPARDVASLNVGKSPETLALERLTPEQQKFIEETYNLALNLYTSGKYDLAALEIGKIFQIIPNYKDARNVLALSQQAIDIKKQKEETERKQREQADLQRKVNDILDDCDRLLATKRFAEVEACVGRTSELDPDNERGQILTSKAQEATLQIKLGKEQRAESIRRKTFAAETFKMAQKAYQEKRYPAAISGFQKVETIAFNDNGGLKQKAKLGVSSAKAKLMEESRTLVKSGKTALDSKDYKTAISDLQKALFIAPDNNEARTYRDQAEKDLRIEMKNLYSESVIEENLGNIESAKKKWRIILEQDLKTDSYFEKARLKLGKYEK